MHEFLKNQRQKCTEILKENRRGRDREEEKENKKEERIIVAF